MFGQSVSSVHADQETPNSRSTFAGLLGLLLVPALVVYVVVGVSPVHRPFPVCCVCDRTWLYEPLVHITEEDFRSVCASVVALGVKPDAFASLTISTLHYGCLEAQYGERCNSSCLEYANMSPLNTSRFAPWRARAYDDKDKDLLERIRIHNTSFGKLGRQLCPSSSVFVCASIFPDRGYDLCDIPDVSGILSVLGAGFGLAMGVFVNAPAGVRVLWRRTPSVRSIGGSPGKRTDVALGFAQVLFGLCYFGLVYVFMNHRSTKAQRAGAILAASIYGLVLFVPLLYMLEYLRVLQLFPLRVGMLTRVI